ncbi:MAG: cobalamin-binding protein [Bacteroidales bacterium]|nr:cobalamin-binding protein [Bacteroidales bacterium]
MAKRIISLVPAATEIVAALGKLDQLVARSHECDYPYAVKKLPAVTKTRFDMPQSSDLTDRAIKDILEIALSVYEIDLDRIRKLKPDVIITQSQCKACAVSTDEIQMALNDYIQDNFITMVDVKPQNLDDALNDIERIGDAIDAEAQAQSLTKNMRAAFNEIESQTTYLTIKPKVSVIEWIEPLMVAGNWTPELIRMAGAMDVPPQNKSRWLVPNDLLAENPEKIIVAPCGFSKSMSHKEMHFLEEKEAWLKLKAVRENEVYIVDGSRFLNRPSPRLVDSLQILAEIIHPEIFNRKFENIGWEKYPIK